jgi:hypothetical protein
MKTLGILLSTAGLAGVGAIALAIPAQGAVAASCSGAKAITSAPMYRNHEPPTFGTIRLCRNGSSQYWAEVTMDSKLVRNQKANAFLVQYSGGNAGKTYSCDSSGGTDTVIAGQRTCRTPRVKSANANVTFMAIGREYQNFGGGWTEVGENATKRTR